MSNGGELSPELERYLKRYAKRTGAFRLYQLDRDRKTQTLLLEFVIRGYVLFHIKLWKRDSKIWNQ
jgi:hypothetical protein